MADSNKLYIIKWCIKNVVKYIKRYNFKLVPSGIRTTTFAVFHLIKNGGGGIRTLRTERMGLVVLRLNHSATRSMAYYKHKQLYQQRS